MQHLIQITSKKENMKELYNYHQGRKKWVFLTNIVGVVRAIQNKMLEFPSHPLYPPLEGYHNWVQQLVKINICTIKHYWIPQFLQEPCCRYPHKPLVFTMQEFRDHTTMLPPEGSVGLLTTKKIIFYDAGFTTIV